VEGVDQMSSSHLPRRSNSNPSQTRQLSAPLSSFLDDNVDETPVSDRPSRLNHQQADDNDDGSLTTLMQR